ncbi:glycoside hydrolase family 13 protein [Amycolatopsis australiensis]|uniref:Alpha-glucosidase n=1 Tax=Amycolatopsis australiensis TaxID=546364 RepID=A0A1K1RT37_9PSEU|nr:glycoside hydrolase family 13 protein [Amycolatopsis australiensis]SFW75241.1 alpha-glucosidase [Amycolatopsis australiensis]
MSIQHRRLPWWRTAVVYQVYLRSFADGNGDGIGDLAGLRSRLDYLADLGVDGIWLNPCYPSPQADHGYDVADYTGIEPAYGSLAEFDTVVDDAHARGIRVLMDLVPNHCSSAHPWFQAALAAAPGSPERDRFVFRDGRGEHGELPPNNWRSEFGGPAWTRVPGPDGEPDQWYLHFFDAGQPDFNWRNPEVPAMFEKVLRFWFDRGVDGFRIDVAHGLYKHADLPDWEGAHYNEFAWDQPEVHDVYRSWRAIADSYGPERDITLVGEVWVPEVTSLAAYLRDDELPQAFFFDLLLQPWSATLFRASIDRAFAEIGATGATITWTLANHDVHRTVTRYGIVRPESLPAEVDAQAARSRPRGEVDVALGQRRARASTMLLLALPGSQFLYQGEEFGLPEVLDFPPGLRQDPTWHRSGEVDYGRDGCRVPLPWSAGGANFGFSPAGTAAAPWLPQPGWFAQHAVDTQIGVEGSTHSLYRAALQLKRTIFPAADTAVTWLPAPGRDDVLAFRRGEATCVVVFGGEPFTPPAEWGTILLRSEPADTGGELPGNSAAWLR